MPTFPTFVKLPNDKIVQLDTEGRITVDVHVELEQFIGNDREGVLDVLSEAATGTELLGDISYKVVGHEGDTLHIEVSGDIELVDAEEVDHDELPEQEFEVQVTRVGYGNRTFRLSAKTEAEAIHMADDDAGNHTYSEHASDYLIEAAAV